MPITDFVCLFVSDAPSTVAAKKQEQEEERARKEKAEKGILTFWVLVESGDIHQ